MQDKTPEEIINSKPSAGQSVKNDTPSYKVLNLYREDFVIEAMREYARQEAEKERIRTINECMKKFGALLKSIRVEQLKTQSND